MKKIKRYQTYFEAMRFAIAILIAFGITFIIMSFSSAHPLEAIKDLFIGPLTNMRRFSTVLETMIPLTFAGLAVCIMFKANQFNLAAEGGMFLGALTAAIVGIYLPGPPFLVTLCALVCGGVVGACVCAIPGIIKIKWGASELVASLMLNYMVQYFGMFLFNATARDPNSAFAASFPLPKGVGLPNIIPRTRLHAGIFIVALCVVFCYIFVNKTKWGYKLRMTGSNIRFAKCAGISTAGVILSSQLIGGTVAGIGGATEMLGMYTRFQWTALPGYGFDGVIIYILAKENPALIPVAAFFLSYLRIGADYMYRQSDVAAEIVAIIQGLVIILVAATAFLSGWKHRMITRLSKEEKGGEAQCQPS